MSPKLRRRWTTRGLDVGFAFARLFTICCAAQDELRIHDEHVAIARQAVEAARIKYTVGKVPQQDILKAQVELTRLAEHMIHFEQDADMASRSAEYAARARSRGPINCPRRLPDPAAAAGN